MKSLRKLVSSAVLTVGVFGLLSSVASAQSARGSFTLSHEVHWQNAVVPAGTYHFSLESKGPSELLTLHNVSGGRESFMILARDVAPSRSSDNNRLVMVSRAGKSFVRTLELPEFETVLHFPVPAAGANEELALVSDTPVPTHLR
jgi:hypothetical protein